MLGSARFLSKICVCIAFLWVSASASAAVVVLPSTQALALVVKEVTGQVYTPLVPAGVSPHDFSLKPSHIRRLQKAQLIVWLGPKLEPYLAKVMSRIPSDKQFIINQGQLPLAYGQHPWTSPEYLRQGMLQLSQHLDAPWNSDQWSQQMLELNTQLQAHKDHLLKNNQGYVVYHDGIGGFEAYFGLQHLASFTNSDDQPPGAKGLAVIAKLANDQQVACVLIDHEVKPKLIDAVIGPNVERITIDILAANATSLSNYMTKLQQAVLSCDGGTD